MPLLKTKLFRTMFGTKHNKVPDIDIDDPFFHRYMESYLSGPKIIGFFKLTFNIICVHFLVNNTLKYSIINSFEFRKILEVLYFLR